MSDQTTHGLYVYCIAESEGLTPLFEQSFPGAIEPDGTLESVAEGDLAAVVSPVALKDYGEEALQSRLTDPTWTALRAMRHEKVVEHFAKRTCVVPLRFGTIYFERAGIERMLREKRADLRRIIEALRGREEWGVNVYCDRSTLVANITRLSERLGQLVRRADDAKPGQSYLIRKEIEGLRETEARSEIKRASRTIENDLSNVADAVERLRVLKDEASDQGELVAKLAFLVGRDRFPKFRDVAETLAREYEGGGFKLELTGPWPPYNFASSW